MNQITQRENEARALERFNAFCTKIDNHNKKSRLVKLITKKLYRLNLKDLIAVLKIVKERAKT